MNRRLDQTLIVLLALAAFAWLPLVTPGYFMQAHDAPHSLFFLEAFDEAVRDGAWWPAWGPNFAFGYGYPLWIFYAPLTYFLGEAFHLLGASITTALKSVDIIATVAATLSMYLWARHHFRRPAAAFAAIVYTYTPYHLLDLYVRSAVAEYFTYVWFPLVLWRWEALLAAPSRRNAMSAAVVTAALILTHHGAAFIFVFLLGAYFLFVLWRHRSLLARRLAYAASAGVLALGLSAIFWLPVLLEQKYIVVDQWTSVAYNYQQHFVFLNQFFSPFWGYGYSGAGLADGMSFQLGLLPVVVALVALVLLRTTRTAEPAQFATTIFFLIAAATTLALMSPISAGFWDAVPLAALVQFPWRLLALSTIALAWLAGAAMEGIGHTLDLDAHAGAAAQASARAPVLIYVMMLLTAAASFNYTLPQYTERSPAGESARAAVDFELVSYRDRTGYMTWASVQPQSSPLVAEYESSAPLTKAIVLRGDAALTILHHGGESDRLRVRAQSAATLQLRTYYFPGWHAQVDGQAAQIYPTGPYALIALDVPAGEHDVSLRFEDTSVRAASKWITFMTILGMIGWAPWRRPGGRQRVYAGMLFVLLLCGCSSATTDNTPEPATTVTQVASRPLPPVTTESVAPTGIATPAATSTPGATATARPSTVQYTVQPNDTLGSIAQKFGTTVDAILRANNMARPEALRAGQTIIIPLPTPTPTLTATATLNPTQAVIAGPTAIIYIVQSGDVLSAIAAKYNLPVDEIMRANGLSDTFLRVGQQLIIPASTVTPTPTTTALPTSTPTEGLAFGAPMLLFPPDGASYGPNDALVMNWTAVGALNDDQFYVLRLRTLDGTRTESIWLKTPSYRLPTSWHDTTIVWDVIVLQVTQVNPDGTREGKIQSAFSEERQFTWQ